MRTCFEWKRMERKIWRDDQEFFNTRNWRQKKMKIVAIYSVPEWWRDPRGPSHQTQIQHPRFDLRKIWNFEIEMTFPSTQTWRHKEMHKGNVRGKKRIFPVLVNLTFFKFSFFDWHSQKNPQFILLAKAVIQTCIFSNPNPSLQPAVKKINRF